MSDRGNDTERAIVAAFLRAGHPRLAFGAVVVRALVRLTVAGGLAVAGAALGKPGLELATASLPLLLG